MSKKTYRVVDAGDTRYVQEDPAGDPTEDYLAEMLFNGVIGADGFSPPVLVDRKGKMFTMNVKFFVTPATKEQQREARIELGLCRRHLRDDCKKCIKSHCDDPDCLGWHVEEKGIVMFDADDTIQCCDDCGRFDSDDSAIKHAHSKKGLKELRKYLRNRKSGG